MLDEDIPPEQYTMIADKRLQRHKVENAHTIMDEYIAKHGVDFDTVITSSDLIAIGALKSLNENGCRVPEDVWLVGYDDISVSSLVMPPLTTVHQDTDRLGEEAFSLLNEMIQSGDHRPKQISIKNSIVIRESALNSAAASAAEA